VGKKDRNGLNGGLERTVEEETSKEKKKINGGIRWRKINRDKNEEEKKKFFF
jgi:hypothetical protein